MTERQSPTPDKSEAADRSASAPAAPAGETKVAYIRHNGDAPDGGAPARGGAPAPRLSPAPVIVAVFAVIAIAAFSWAAYAYSQGQDAIAIVASAFGAPSGGERAKQSVAPSAGSAQSAAPAAGSADSASGGNPAGQGSAGAGGNGTGGTTSDGASSDNGAGAPDSDTSGAQGGGSGQTSAPADQGGSPDSAPAPEESSQITVTVSIDASLVGAAGGSTTVTLERGATAYDALLASGVSVSARPTGFGIYVDAINGVAEKQAGPTSGWVYTVNGGRVNVACSSYEMGDGDYLSWTYVTGAD
ncbi:DUF4430 domain-containing protein [Olsenella intestinalis]|uniref:DUF4430 domain-containing protein n=1 Tax=Olsenella intestinalis TaxID=2930083 RepID=UPI0031FF09E1